MTVTGRVTSKFQASPIYRWGSVIGVAAALAGLVDAVATLGSDDGTWRVAFLIASSYAAVYFAWLGYRLWRYPVVRVTADAIEWRHLVGPARRLPIADVAGIRWQDSFDLRLQTRAGDEWSLRLGAMSRKGRERLAFLFNGMFEHGSLSGRGDR